MSENIKIKLNVADRVYPLTISPDQEASPRASAKKIEMMTKQLENNYAVRDKQDVLAMCALQLALQLRQEGKKSSENTDEIEKKLRNIDEILSTLT